MSRRGATIGFIVFAFKAGLLRKKDDKKNNN